MSEEHMQNNITDIKDAASEEAKAAQPAEKQEEEEERYTFWKFVTDFLDIAETAVITVFVFMMLYAYLFRPVNVDGSSMVPTLRNADRVLVLNSWLHSPKNGQIVVIDDAEGALYEHGSQTELQNTNPLDIVLIKRLIAKGGQEVNIDFENGAVAVDGVQLAEDYIADLTHRDDGAFTYPVTVPEGYYFVMGDNRNGSTDSRSPNVGFIPEDQLIGTVVLRYDRDEELRSSWLERFDWLF